MKMLLIEDDDYKAAQIVDFLNPVHSIKVVKAYQSGLRAIMSEQFDILLLDMSMPSFELSTRHRSFGGKDILFEMRRKNVEIPTIVVTQYSVFDVERENVTLSQLDEQLKKEFDDVYYGMVHYNAASIDWTGKLQKIIESVEELNAKNINC